MKSVIFFLSLSMGMSAMAATQVAPVPRPLSERPKAKVAPVPRPLSERPTQVAPVPRPLWERPSTKEVLTCTFTEPFITVTFYVENRFVTIVDGVMETTQVIGKANWVEVADADYAAEVIDPQGATILTLYWKTGNDGMSDRNYPIEATYGDLVGGCATKKYPATEKTDYSDANFDRMDLFNSLY